MTESLKPQILDPIVDWPAELDKLCRRKLKAGPTTMALLTERNAAGDGPAFRRVSRRAIQFTDPKGLLAAFPTLLPELLREGARLDAAGSEAEAIEVAYFFEQIAEALKITHWFKPVGGAYDFLASFAGKREDFALALRYHDQAIRLNPDQPSFHLNKAETLRRSGRAREYIHLLLDVAERWPDNTRARELASENVNLFVAVHANDGCMSLDDAVGGFENAVMIDPNNRLAFRNGLYVLRDQGRATQADIDRVAHLFADLDLSGPEAYRPRT